MSVNVPIRAEIVGTHEGILPSGPLAGFPARCSLYRVPSAYADAGAYYLAFQVTAPEEALKAAGVVDRKGWRCHRYTGKNAAGAVRNFEQFKAEVPAHV